MAWPCMAGTGPLVPTDDVASDRCITMNCEVFSGSLDCLKIGKIKAEINNSIT